jgi:hypothetical protein
VAKEEKPALVTAGIDPLDFDGMRTIGVGTAVWLVAFLALLPFYGSLDASGRTWWLWTCVAGFSLGVVGLEYCRRRRKQRRSQPDRPVETSPLGAAGL